MKSHQTLSLGLSQSPPWCAALVCILGLASLAFAEQGHDLQSDGSTSRQRYRIEISLDYRAATFTGREVVRFTNSTRNELESVYFHLYPNLGLGESEEPWLTISRVSHGSRDLRFNLKSRGAVLKVALPSKLDPGQSVELTIDFAARIPRVQREETSLLAHFLQEVNDAMSDDRQSRDSRDIFFAGEQAMLLGYFYPLLATRQVFSGDYNLVIGVGGIVFADVADYEVTVKLENGIVVVGSGSSAGHKVVAPSDPAGPSRQEYSFRGRNLRGFALAIGERLKAVEKQVGPVVVVSYFREGDERLGQRMLEVAARSLEAYNAAFGSYPYPVLNVVELPMPAGYSGIEFPAMAVLAQAYYIDFEAPEAARLPGIVREQSDLIKAALEFTLAHATAHQWWGGVVGSDPQRNPFLDEALANYSAAYYYEVAYGRAAGVTAIDQQLRATYQAYRMLGGTDLEVDKSAKDFRSSLQYTAIVQAKGALLFAALRKELGDERFFSALRHYYTAHRFQIATPDHLRYAFLASADDHRVVKALFQRWIKEKRGDEDIGAPEVTLLAPPNSSPNSSKARTLGRIFVRIGRTAARPF